MRDKIRIELSSESRLGWEPFYAVLDLPATAQQIRDARQKARITGREDMTYQSVTMVEFEPLPNLEHIRLDTTSVEELNYLAQRLDSLSDEQFTIYQALFDQRFGNVDSDELLSVKDLINMTYGLDSVMVASNIHNDEQLGQFVIENDLHPDVAAIPDDSLYLLDKRRIGELQRKNEGGVLIEWVDGINDMLTEDGILLGGTRFHDCSTFEHDGSTCLLFPFKDDVELDVGKLAMWRLQTHGNFGGTWLSDYVPNKLGGFFSKEQTAETVQKPDCPLIGQDGNIFNAFPNGLRRSSPNSNLPMRTSPKESRWEVCRMRTKIYQINSKRDVNRVKFEGLDLLERYQGSSAVDPSIYDEVFSAEIDETDLEQIYQRFNTVGHDLNADGIPTPSGIGQWQRGTIESILTNEKYKGDAVLNKTYIRDCLSKKVMINNGERPKYYVENNHPAIIDSGTFGRVQEEMARRGGKRKVKQVGTKTEQGRYSSRYALTELLICGECGTPYRRCTWTANGKKKIVWRCINRLDYGKKYCHDSPSVEESVLQEAIMKSVLQTAKQNAEVLKTLKLHIGMGLSAETTEDNSLDLQIRIAEIETEFQKMLKAIAADNVEAFDEEKAKALMDEKAKLQIQLDRIADTKQKRENAKSRLDEIFTIIEALANHPISYDNQIVRQILESVIVESKDRIKVVFIGGLEVTQLL